MTVSNAGPMGPRQARLLRVRRLRTRVVTGAVALFVAVFLLITVLLVSGHDPALGHTRTTAVARSTSSSASGSGSSSGSGTGSSAAGGTGSTSGSSTGSTSARSGSGLSSVTSSQS